MMKSNNSRFVFKPVMVVCLGLVFVGLILYGGYPPPVQASCSWSGDWNTTWGGSSFTLMILAQSGNQASGSYAYNGGTLEGTVSGSTLSGNWLQSNSSGTISFIMAADCNSFQGSWQGTTGNGGWNGTRVSAIPTPTLRPTNTSVPVTSTPLPTHTPIPPPTSTSPPTNTATSIPTLTNTPNPTATLARWFTISGKVTNAQNTPIPGVSLEIRSIPVTNPPLTLLARGGRPLFQTNSFGRYSSNKLKAGNYLVRPVTGNFTPTYRLVTLGPNRSSVNFQQQTVITGVPKGANWLQNQSYNSANNIRWNLDVSYDVVNDATKRANIVPTIHGLSTQGITTIIRLDIKEKENRPPIITRTIPVTSVNCATLVKQYMKEYERQYTETVRLLGTGALPYIFILGNEPNHDDEWSYNGYQYAYVYNCYYKYWFSQPRYPLHKLYVAGPGQPNLITLTSAISFYEQLFRNQPSIVTPTKISAADGFGIHAYGYGSDNPDRINNEFSRWLYNGLDKINQGLPNSKSPVIVTEYNPGAQIDAAGITQVGGRANGWVDWFNTNQCTADYYNYNYSYFNGRLKGLLYFVDSSDGGRPNNCEGIWCAVALQNTIDDRRNAWLNAQSMNCPGRTPVNRSRYEVVNTRMVIEPTPTATIPPTVTPTPNPSILQGAISGILPNNYEGYQVVSDLIIPQGQILTIEPGAELYFAPQTKLTVAGQLWIQNAVTFQASKAELGWKGIEFLPSARGSYCGGCYIYNIEPNGIALTVRAPITIGRYGVIQNVPNGTAISATVPFTLYNVVIDSVKTALYITGTPTATFKATYLTVTRCQQGVVNRGQRLLLDNSIIASCDNPLVTNLKGSTIISYSLLSDYITNTTHAGATLRFGPGMLDNIDPQFNGFPSDLTLSETSPAVNAADPTADFGEEWGYNGGRADLGAYGNTALATEIIPYNRLGVAATVLSPTMQIAQPGDEVPFTLLVTNTGLVGDSFHAGSASSSELFWHLDFGWTVESGWQSSFWLQPQQVVTKPFVFHVSGEARGYEGPGVAYPHSPNGIYQLPLSVRSFGVSTTSAFTIAIPHYLQTKNQVVLEAENAIRNYPATHQQWFSQMVLTGYVGSRYMTTIPVTPTQPPDNQWPQLSYTIYFTYPGTYTLWLRGQSSHSNAQVMASLSGQPTVTVTGFATNTWSWSNQDAQGRAVRLILPSSWSSPAYHVLRVWTNQTDVTLDRILLTQDDDYTPSAGGPPESEFHGQQGSMERSQAQPRLGVASVANQTLYLPLIVK